MLQDLSNFDKVRELFSDMTKSHNLNKLLMKIQYRLFTSDGDQDEVVRSEIERELKSVECVKKNLEKEEEILIKLLTKL